MAHLVETMAYAGELPWHGLGVKVLPDLTPEQILKEAGLDWEVEMIPAFADIRGKKVAVGKSALVRSSDDRVLTVVSDDWHPVQNQEAFAFFEQFVAAGDMEMHTAGSLADGELVWALAKNKESFSLFGGRDQVDNYTLFTNPHRYGKSIDVRQTAIRVVCNNTLTMALANEEATKVLWSHRRQFDADKVKELMGVSRHQLDTYKEAANFLSSKRAKEENIVEYFKRLWPMNSTKEAPRKDMSKLASYAIDVLETQPGAEFGAGTWWQAFNAVTFTVDHLAGRNDNNRLNSAWYGAGRKLKVESLQLATEYAQAA